MNRQIRAREVRVIDSEGEQIGIMSADEGREMAQDRGLDLVEVAPKAKPPVCRIMDYGKFRYKQSKRKSKKSDTPTLKTIRLRPKTDDHDLQVKMRKAKDFLNNGDKVKFVVQMRGREKYLKERWIEQLNENIVDLEEDMGDELHVIQRPRGEGSRIIAVIETA